VEYRLTSVLVASIFLDLYVSGIEWTRVFLSIRLCSGYVPRLVFTGSQEYPMSTGLLSRLGCCFVKT
jgi:hypothetical protein